MGRIQREIKKNICQLKSNIKRFSSEKILSIEILRLATLHNDTKKIQYQTTLRTNNQGTTLHRLIIHY